MSDTIARLRAGKPPLASLADMVPVMRLVDAAYAKTSDPLIPAQAGIQGQGLGPRFRGGRAVRKSVRACQPAARASYGRRMADVRLEGITKTWGTTAAVEDVSFSAPAGHLVALLGPSGCGKSTTLRLIAGLETASAGTIIIADRDVTALPPAKRGVSMVFQSYALFPHLSVAENILFGLQGARRAEARSATRGSSAPPASSGSRRCSTASPRSSPAASSSASRSAARSWRRRKVCLMDEPLSNLDAQLRVEMRREIRALQRRLGMTMLYVTHDQVEAMTMADQVVLMRNGRIEQDAAPAALYEKPATIFAARFVGTPPMNVIPAALVPADLAPPAGGRARDTLAIGIRPEAARIGANGMPATVAAVEYLGADTLIDTRIADQSFIVRLPGRATVQCRRQCRHRAGSRRRALVRSVVTMSYRSMKQQTPPQGENIMDRRTIPRRHRGARRQRRIAKPALAQGATEVSFFYPIAVGGPITKIIDGYAADFEKANPSIKVKPIYSGTYQESITKALTAHKSGTPPVTSVLLSTDMFTLIDEEAIVPIDPFIKTDDDKKWMASFFPAFMENSRTGGKTWGVPFQRSTIVLYWNKDLFKEAGLDPEKAPATWAEMQAFAEKLTKRDASGNTTQWGVQIPSSGFPYWLFQGLTTPAGAHPDERGGRPHLLRQARGDRGAAATGSTSRASTRSIRPASSNGAPRRRISSSARSP